jgi:hypothetical protein
MTAKRQLLRRYVIDRLVPLAVLVLVLWLMVAYLLLPAGWRWFAKRHPALDGAPTVTCAATGIPGDPLNVAFIGSKDDLLAAMAAAQWKPADPVTARTSVEIAASTVLHRSYDTAPVSNLFLWGRKEDLAFEQPMGHDARRRHHVRFWRAPQVDSAGRPLWFGAATFDRKVGFSHTTAQITHHIDADVDAERDKLLDDLRAAGRVLSVQWLDDFQKKLAGRNGGGDPYHTDGRLVLGVLAAQHD